MTLHHCPLWWRFVFPMRGEPSRTISGGRLPTRATQGWLTPAVWHPKALRAEFSPGVQLEVLKTMIAGSMVSVLGETFEARAWLKHLPCAEGLYCERDQDEPVGAIVPAGMKVDVEHPVDCSLTFLDEAWAAIYEKREPWHLVVTLDCLGEVP